MKSVLTKILPPAGPGRTLAVQSMVYSIGSGTFLTGSAVFFTKVVELSPEQVGIGLSAAGAVSFLLAVPLGRLTDRIGARRAWILAIFGEAVAYAFYPMARGFVSFLGVVLVLSVIESVGNSGRGAYTIELLPGDQRVKVMAYVRSALNIGFTAGAGIAAIALALDEMWAYYAMAVLNAVILLGNAAFVMRLPRTVEGTVPGGAKARGIGVIGDIPFMVVSALNGLLQSHITVITIVIPLWLVAHTAAPDTLLGGLVILNTLVVIFLQVPFSRGAETVAGAASALRRAGVAMGVGCVLLALSVAGSSIVATSALLLGYLLFTFGELVQSAGQWGLSAELPPADRRAEYLSGMRLGTQGQRMVGPALFTGLVMTFGYAGWLLLGVVLVIAGLLAVPASSWSARRIGEAKRGDVAMQHQV